MAAGPTKDVKEFQFKVSGQLKVFSSNEKLNTESPVKLVASSSKYGLVFVGTPTGVTSIITSSILNNAEIQSKPLTITSEFPRRSFPLPSQPSHVDVSADNEFLAVAIYIQNIPVLQIYSVASFASMNIVKKNEMRMSNTAGVRVVDLQWNPGVPNMIGAVMSDGSALVFELKDSAFTLNSVPPTAKAKCLCWSPKGKQVVIGSADGSLTQYKPDLKPVKTFPPPFQPASIVSVFWPSSFQFIAAYFNPSTPHDRPAIVVVNVPKGAPTTYVRYEDICFGSLSKRPEFHFIFQQTWNVIVVGCGDSMELSVLGLDGANWVHWKQDESTRAELPLTDDKDDTHNLGISLDTSRTQPIQINDSLSVPPMPIVMSLSHDGVLCLFTTLNLLPGAAPICSAPQPFPDQSGFSLFTAGPTKAAAAVEPAKPAVQTVAAQPASQAAPAFSQSGSLFGATPQQPSGGLFSKPSSNFPASTFGQPAMTSTSTLSQPSLFGTSSPFAQSNPLFPKSTSVFQTLTPSITQSTPPLQPVVPGTTQSSNVSFSITPQAPATAVTAPQISVTIKPVAPAVTSAPSFGGTAQSSSLFAGGLAKSTGSAAVPASQPSLTISGFGLNSSQPGKDQVKTETKPVIEAKQTIPSVTQVTPEAKLPEEVPDKSEIDKAAYTAAIHEELTSFVEEFSAIKKYLGNLKVKVGEEKMKGEVSCKMDNFETFSNELVETTQAQCSEISSLKVTHLDMVSWIQLIKTKQQISQNPSLIEMRQAEDMDPIGKHWCKRIEQRLYSLQSQIKLAVEQMESIKNASKGSGLQLPTFEAVLQTIITQTKIANAQRARITNIEDKMKERIKRYHQRKKKIIEKQRPKGDKFLDKDSQLSTLAQKLLQTKLESSEDDSVPCSYRESSKMMIAKEASGKKIDSAKETSLKNWLKNHKTVYSKVVPLQSNMSSNFDSPIKPVSKSIDVKNSPGTIPAKELETPVSQFIKPVPTTPSKTENKHLPTNRNLFATISEGTGADTGIAPLNQEVKGLFMGSVTSTPIPSILKKDQTKSTGLPALQTIVVSSSSATETTSPFTSPKSGVIPFGSLAGNSQVTITPTKSSTTSNVNPSEIQSKSSVEAPKTIGFGGSQNSFGFGKVTSKENTTSDSSNIFQASKPAVKPAVYGTVNQPSSDKPAATSDANTLSFDFGSMASTLKGPAITSTAKPQAPAKVEVSSFSFGGISDTLNVPSSTAPVMTTSSSLFPFSQSSATSTNASGAPAVSITNPLSTFSFGSVASSQSGPTVPNTAVNQSSTPSIFGGSLPTVSSPAVSIPSTTAASVTPAPSSPAAAVSPVGSELSTPVFGSPVSPAQSAASITTLPSLASSKSSVVTTTSISSSTTPTVTGTTTPSSTPSLFGAPVSSPTSSAVSTSTTSAAPSIFTSQVSFGSLKPPTTSAPTFGGSAFGTLGASATTAAPPVFGAGTLKFTAASTAPSVFGQAVSTAVTTPASIFNQAATATTTAASPFGQPTTTTQAPTSPFGQPALAQSTAASPFSQATTTASPFGASPFGSGPVFSSIGNSTFGGGSTFGTPAATPSVFGTPSTTSATSSLFNTPLFGQTATQNTSSPFGNVASQPSPFGGSTPTSQAPAFGAPAAPANPFFGQSQPASVFGQSPSAGNFGSSGGSLFGGSASFGSSPQGGSFSSGGSIFGGGGGGGGPFSSGAQSVGQSGFGAAPSFQSPKPASGFGSAPVFGNSPAFGGSPAFGTSPTFGSPNKTFGATTPVASPGGGFGGQGNVFENLANQNTMSFGNLAQGQPQGMAPSFGSPQPQQQNSNPTFGGNAFSSWR